MLVIAVDKPELPPLTMPVRFRHDIAYFMTPADASGVPPLAAGEYWIRLADAQNWLEEGVLHIVSPLDSQKKAEVPLSDEHETWLEWMVANQVQRVRLQ